MSTDDPIGYIVYRPTESGIPSILANAVPDGGGTIYVKQAAVDRLTELRRHSLDDYRMAAVVPVEVELARPAAEADASGSGALYACVPTKDTEHARQETTDAEIDAGLLDDPSTPARREQDEDVDADLPGLLVRELRVSDPKEFGRPAMPSVYAEYEALSAANGGGLVYDAEAKSYLTERHGVPEELQKHLDHEIYLASGQLRLARMVADEQAAREQGWVAITEIAPAEGMVLEGRTLRGGPFRLKSNGRVYPPWVLVPKGKRTHGLNFTRLVQQHEAFEAAKYRGQVAMDAPAVVMVRIVKKGD